jgi:glycosyltransferase involved in cell wall biosynthesis
LSCSKPRVSIGLPVFNGEKYLKEALDSILAQTYSDFELVISDNASTDHTQQICRTYIAKDSRIRYYRNKKDMGVSWNHNRVFELSSGEYFKWAAYDDVLAPDFLSRCVSILDQDLSIVLCHCKTGCINEQGDLIGKYNIGARICSPKQHERFGAIVSMRNYAWILILGVIRSSYLRKTRLFGNYIGTDRNLLAELSLLGPMYEIPEVLFFRRKHPQAYTDKSHNNYAEKLDWWVKTRTPALIFPYWKICLEYFNSVRLAPLKWSGKQLCYAQIIKWFLREGWILMSIDLGINLFNRSKFFRMFTPLSRFLFRKSGIK